MRIADTNAVAKHTGLAATTLVLWRCERRGPPFMKAGGRVLYDLDQVEKWLASLTVRPRGRKRAKKVA